LSGSRRSKLFWNDKHATASTNPGDPGKYVTDPLCLSGGEKRFADEFQHRRVSSRRLSQNVQRRNEIANVSQSQAVYFSEAEDSGIEEKGIKHWLNVGCGNDLLTFEEWS
jgi:hypothetical protein